MAEATAENPPVKYIAGFIAADEATRDFEALQKELLWERHTSKRFGKDSPVPRQEVWIAEKPYKYSGRTYQPHPWTPALEEIKQAVERVAGSEFNSVLVNLYESGADSLGWHADDEPEMYHEHPIASVSLGATRTFQIRRGKEGPIQTIELEPGSLLLMAPGMQREWLHCLPKTKVPCDPRINLTFRWMVF